MFGPNAASIAGRNIIVCSCGNDTAADEAADLFSGGTILRMEITEHDPIAAYVLGLTHAVNLAFSGALVRSGFSAETLCAAASTTFSRQTAVSSSVSRENAELYYSIQTENPYTEAAVQNLSDALLALRSSPEDEFREKNA